MGFWELVLILVLVLLFFGAGKLGGLGAGLGKAARGFRDAVGGTRDEPRDRSTRPPRE